MITEHHMVIYYNVQARRVGTEKWTAWAICRNVDDAFRQADIIASLGHEYRILVERLHSRLFNKIEI